MFSHPSLLLFSLLSDLIILSHYSFIHINGERHMSPHKPPLSSSLLFHCHGDSGESSLHGRTCQRHAMLPCCPTGTHTLTLLQLTVWKKHIAILLPSVTQCLIFIFPVQHLFSWVSVKSHVTDSFISPVPGGSNSFYKGLHSNSEVWRGIGDLGHGTHRVCWEGLQQ